MNPKYCTSKELSLRLWEAGFRGETYLMLEFLLKEGILK